MEASCGAVEVREKKQANPAAAKLLPKQGVRSQLRVAGSSNRDGELGLAFSFFGRFGQLLFTRYFPCHPSTEECKRFVFVLIRLGLKY